jgi:lipopolysaccharide export system protein LptA
VKIRSNELRITLAKSDDAKPSATQAADELGDASASKLQSAVATGNVRIDQGTRWAVGGRATFDQTNRTLVLTENPVLHDGPNEVAGDKVVVFLDKDTAVVEGGRNKRVKGYFVPAKDGQKAGAKPADAKPAAAAAGAKPAEATR